MALKDWKKVLNKKETIVYKTKKIRGVKIIDTLRIFKENKNKWNVIIYRNDGFSSSTVAKRRFNLKSTALAYAKRYMKSHY